MRIAGDVAATEYAAPQEVTSDEAKAAREWLLGYLEHYELVARTEARRITGGWKIGIYCPLTETDAQPHDEGVAKQAPCLQIINGKLSFKCSAQHLRKAKEEYGCVQTGNVTAQLYPVFARTWTGRGCCAWKQHGGQGHSRLFCKRTWLLIFSRTIKTLHSLPMSTRRCLRHGRGRRGSCARIGGC